MARLAILAAFIASLGIGPVWAAEQPVQFRELLSSPTGRYLIYVVTSPNKTDRFFPVTSSLYIRDQHTGRASKIMDFTVADALWAPGADTIFVNRHLTSSNDDCTIVDLSSGSPRTVSMAREMQKEHPRNRHLFGGINDHIYFRCSRWLNNDLVVVNARATGPLDRGGYIKQFTYKVER